jgi:ribonuclease HI
MREKFHPMVVIATLTYTLCTHNSNAGYVGVGLVARDFMDHLKVAKRLSFPVLTDAYNAELMAASQAVIFCSQAGFLNVILEGDDLKVIKDVNSPPPIFLEVDIC